MFIISDGLGIFNNDGESDIKKPMDLGRTSLAEAF